jgi:hypothetical protein
MNSSRIPRLPPQRCTCMEPAAVQVARATALVHRLIDITLRQVERAVLSEASHHGVPVNIKHLHVAGFDLTLTMHIRT